VENTVVLKILITGASGFIGCNLLELFRCRYAVKAPSRSELDLLNDRAVQQYLQSERFDVVLHCATVRSNRMQGAPPELFRDNCKMFFNLVRNGSEFGKMITFGSGLEYDRRNFQPRMSEEYFDSHIPCDDYGFSKYVCAKAVDLFPNVIELRLFGVFGPHESWEVRFISNACCRAMWDLPVSMRQNVFFDYLDVRDLGQVVEWFMLNTPKGRHYNVCSGQVLDLKSIAGKVLEAAGKNLPIHVKHEGFGVEYSGDNSMLLEEIGCFKFRDIESSIQDLYNWYCARRHSINPAKLHFDD
jgi:UDP-glucose 4-epimerase